MAKDCKIIDFQLCPSPQIIYFATMSMLVPNNTWYPPPAFPFLYLSYLCKLQNLCQILASVKQG